MTVKELKEKLEGIDENLNVIISIPYEIDVNAEDIIISNKTIRIIGINSLNR